MIGLTQRTKDFGVDGEGLAARFLESKGYRIVERNWRIRSAEIDLIAERNGVIVFVEVKTRHSKKFGRPAEAVDARKQKKIIEAAGVFLQREEYARSACRFDVIEVFELDGEWTLNQIENAFEAG